uniref:probable zinc transporter 12 n=1 Tax=Erigeron canadensis TaxID=72917 RepID=UPI001CB96B03|nr:probable zinc transporter 12 [Erigeron canadensis]
MNLKLVFILLLLPIIISAECTCEKSNNYQESNHNKSLALKFKLIAIVAILGASVLGVCLPLVGRFQPESNLFLAIKFFAAGVILATGFVHVLPDANESLDNPCLGDKGWGDFPLGNAVAMLAAVFVMIVEILITSWFSNKKVVHEGDLEKNDGHIHSTHTSHGHAHGSNILDSGSSEVLFRHRVISYVLEVGIIIHSVIIGISLGVSCRPKMIKPLIIALSFHQMFEGMGLGSCITEAQFKLKRIATMLIFFSLTTPIGIVIGFGISKIYDENSRKALIVQGLLNAASAGILIYMALVDFLAMDIMKSKVQESVKLKILAFISLLSGIGGMSLLALWT